MKTNPDPEPEGDLLDAVLRDENWQATSAAFKAEVMGAFRARQRQRRLTRWATSVAVVAVAAGLAVHWLGHPALKPREIALDLTQPPRTAAESRPLSDEELLALFPEGSCLAEIDGQKELIFLDAKDEQIYLSKAGAPGR